MVTADFCPGLNIYNQLNYAYSVYILVLPKTVPHMKVEWRCELLWEAGKHKEKWVQNLGNKGRLPAVEMVNVETVDL